jgi:hypothetical protein
MCKMKDCPTCSLTSGSCCSGTIAEGRTCGCNTEAGEQWEKANSVVEVADWWRRPNQCTGGGMTGTLTPTTIAVGPSGSHVACSTCTIQSLVNVQITRFFVTLHQPLRLTWKINIYRITHSSLWQEDRIAMEWRMPIWLFAGGTLTYFTPVLLLLYPSYCEESLLLSSACVCTSSLTSGHSVQVLLLVMFKSWASLTSDLPVYGTSPCLPAANNGQMVRKSLQFLHLDRPLIPPIQTQDFYLSLISCPELIQQLRMITQLSMQGVCCIDMVGIHLLRSSHPSLCIL